MNQTNQLWSIANDKSNLKMDKYKNLCLNMYF